MADLFVETIPIIVVVIGAVITYIFELKKTRDFSLVEKLWDAKLSGLNSIYHSLITLSSIVNNIVDMRTDKMENPKSGLQKLVRALSFTQAIETSLDIEIPKVRSEPDGVELTLGTIPMGIDDQNASLLADRSNLVTFGSLNALAISTALDIKKKILSLGLIIEDPKLLPTAKRITVQCLYVCGKETKEELDSTIKLDEAMTIIKNGVGDFKNGVIQELQFTRMGKHKTYTVEEKDISDAIKDYDF